MTIDLYDPIDAAPGDRIMFRAALRGALIRYAVDCREHAEYAREDDAAELITEAHRAMVQALRLEDA